MIDLSILNLAPVRKGESYAQTYDRLTDLAIHADKLGYKRFWIAEHHNSPDMASAATSLLIQRVLDKTEQIRVGSGGVMLPNHSPFIVAEQYGTLATMYPNRVDLGVGRAAGTDGATARAIRRHNLDFENNFGADVQELQFYFGEPTDKKYVRAYPAVDLNVPLYILGSSPESAYLAAQLGLPYVFGSHFAPRFLQMAVDAYRANFKPSKQLDKPYVILGMSAIVADTDEEAKFLATSDLQFFINTTKLEDASLVPPSLDIGKDTEQDIVNMAKGMMSFGVLGSKETALAQLRQIQSQVQADEFIAVNYIYDQDKQKRSYELLMDVAKAV
ncbi:luciferase family oxidoreductase group 1 [Neisseria sp. HSC-16F19]|nr:LLM class flavin-dependent oxidoreductase [Neisseria sp. HSC-16F19]MCP2041578.1 luciferase family oxidoreductase group 1 [Neisseria sp. HSC-16F19]